jgi:aminoglycoside phosphotransferase family enzyme
MESYSEVVEVMQNPKTYGESVSNIEMIQTHISFVFLANEFAYKVKKPVDFGFLDYTTLERRLFYCNEEIKINRPLCSDMYVGVVSLNKDKKGRVRIGGDGKIIEYAVKMKRQPENSIMTRLLEKGMVNQDHVDKIAKLLSDFHKETQTGLGVNEYGSISQVKANWFQNFEQTKALRGKLLEQVKFDFLEMKIMDFMEKNNELFEKRIKDGRIRQCHGDVHSGNIFILPGGQIYIFDAIEFFKGFSCSDVASEMAFLAMDLDFQGRGDLSDYFVERYLEHSKDREITPMLNFYLAYRAFVRAKVIGFKIYDDSVSRSEKEESKELTVKYFNLAYKYSTRL